MLNVPGQVKVFLATSPADLRKSFDSLAALVREVLALDPFSGHLFVFRSKRGDRLKLLYWDSDGYALWYKRLERGTFHFPSSNVVGEASVCVSAADLTALLSGIELSSVQRAPRYQRPA